MSVALDFSKGGALTLNSQVNSTAAQWRVSIKARHTGAVGDHATLFRRNSDRFLMSVGIWPSSDFGGTDIVRLRLDSTNFDLTSPDGQTVLSDGEMHVIDLVANGTTVELFIDGVSQDTLPCTLPFTSYDRLDNTEATACDLEYIKVYESTDTSNLIHDWTAANSNTSNTGASPVLVDSVAGNNATGGPAWPTDGSAFIVAAVPDPAVTTGDTLRPGTDFTLTATNFSSPPVSPVTLTDSQGSTITVPVTISGSGPYTAVGTMPTLAEAVTAGTSLLFGDVTIELTT